MKAPMVTGPSSSGPPNFTSFSDMYRYLSKEGEPTPDPPRRNTVVENPLVQAALELSLHTPSSLREEATIAKEDQTVLVNLHPQRVLYEAMAYQ